MDELKAHDWERLAEMRGEFLEAGMSSESTGIADYWTNRRDLEIYDATFGARIGWKWNAVMSELDLRGIVPPAGHVLDWGCGTGVAARAYLNALGMRNVHNLSLTDRSQAAEAFARERVREEHPDVVFGHDEAAEFDDMDVLLLSHVIGELDEAGLAELLALVRKSRFVVWVEAGTHAVSRRLSALRDELHGEFAALAPCTHDAACGILAKGQESNWCHHFARPPSEVHQSRHWSQFSRELGIDLRSLPYSFLVLARRASGTSVTDAGSARILGRPRIEKASARIDACDRDGVHQWHLLKREDKRVFKTLGDAAGECLIFDWSVEGSRIHDPRRTFGTPVEESHETTDDPST